MALGTTEQHHQQLVVDYEELPAGAPTSITLLAGALAGITEHTVTYPLDSIKVRINH